METTNLGFRALGIIVLLQKIEYGFGYIITRSPYTSYFIYLRGTIHQHDNPTKGLAFVSVCIDVHVHLHGNFMDR